MQRVGYHGLLRRGQVDARAGRWAKLGLPVIHLDALYWLPGWVERDRAEFRALLAPARGRRALDLDGNYATTLDMRLPRADTIVVIDQPRLLCLWRVTWRWLTHIGRTRADMSEGCPEKVDWEFTRFIWNYPSHMAEAAKPSRRSAASPADPPHQRPPDPRFRRGLPGKIRRGSGSGPRRTPRPSWRKRPAGRRACAR